MRWGRDDPEEQEERHSMFLQQGRNRFIRQLHESETVTRRGHVGLGPRLRCEEARLASARAVKPCFDERRTALHLARIRRVRLPGAVQTVVVAHARVAARLARGTLVGCQQVGERIHFWILMAGGADCGGMLGQLAEHTCLPGDRCRGATPAPTAAAAAAGF